MLDRLKFWQKAKVTETPTLTTEELNLLSPEVAKAYFDSGRSIKVVEEALGDGKAEFLGEGSPEEFELQEKEDKGLKGIFGTK